MPNPVKQHFHAQAILRNFRAKGEDLLWVYDRKTKRYEQKSPRQIARVRHLYSLRSPEAVGNRYIIEKAFASLENKAAPAFAKLRNRESVTQEERDAICEFVGMQAVRTPEQLGIMNHMLKVGGDEAVRLMAQEMADMPPDEFQDFLNRYSATGGDTTHITQAAVKEAIEERRIASRPKKDGRTFTMVDIGTEYTLDFSRRSWVTLHTKQGDSYISSDATTVNMLDGDIPPFMQGGGPTSPGMAVVFPFARDAALLIKSNYARTMGHATHSRAGVKKLNRQISQESNQLYSHSKPLLASLVKHSRLDEWTQEVVFDDEVIRRSIASYIKRKRNSGKHAESSTAAVDA